MSDLRLIANHLVGRKFKTKIWVSGEVHIWNKAREFTIDKVYEHHVLCHHDCEDSGNTYRESFTGADLEILGVLDQIRRGG